MGFLISLPKERSMELRERWPFIAIRAGDAAEFTRAFHGTQAWLLRKRMLYAQSQILRTDYLLIKAHVVGDDDLCLRERLGECIQDHAYGLAIRQGSFG